MNGTGDLYSSLSILPGDKTLTHSRSQWDDPEGLDVGQSNSLMNLRKKIEQSSAREIRAVEVVSLSSCYKTRLFHLVN